MASISCQHIYKIYPGATAPSVTDFNLEIQDKEFIIFVGPSGCGKSTTLRMIAGLEDITSGSLHMRGQVVNNVACGDRGVSMVFQNYALFPHMTVKNNIIYGLKAHKMEAAEINRRLEEVLEMLQLKGLEDRKPKDLSGGQRQRIGIARALAVNPKFIVCDEAVSALDVSIQAQVVNMFEELQEKLGVAYLFIAHDLLVVHHISDRIAVMYLGKMMEIADADELNANPIHPYTLSLLSAVPIPDPETARKSHRIVLEGDVPSPLKMPTGCPFRTRCKYATEKCGQEMPQLTDRGNGHMVACWNK